MTALQTMLKKAEGFPQPADADEEIVDSLKALSDDTEEVSAFLHNLIEIDQARAGQYLVQCRVFLPNLFADLKQANDPMMEYQEEDEEAPMEEDEEAPMEEDEELPPEEGTDDLPPEMGMEEEPAPMDDEELPPEEGMEELPEEPAPEEGMEEEMPSEEGLPPEMGMEEPEDEGEPGEEEVAVEPVVDQDELEQEEASADDLDMVLFEASAGKPHWSVFYKGRPLCAIRLADQENSEEIQEIFVSEEYPKHIKDACAGPIGIRETLNSVQAHWYMGVVDVGQVAAEARDAAGKELEDEFAGRLASLKEDLLNTVNLAIVASNKGSRGLFVENKLKAACVSVLRDAGVANAAGALNEVWAEAAQDYMQDVLKVAEKWLGYSPEAMQEVTAEIVGTEVEPEFETEVEETPADIQAAARREASSGIQNVPIRTRQPQSHGSEDDYRQATTTRVASALSRRMGQRRLGG